MINQRDKDGFVNFLGRNNVLVNTDESSYDAYIRARKEISSDREKIDRINTINEDVTELKKEFSELKTLLVQLLDKK
jgi:hypothetical protein